MSEYRSALRAARERIEQLEALAPPARAPLRAFSFTRVIALLAIAVPVVAVLTAATSAVRAKTLAPAVTSTLPSAPPKAEPAAAPPQGLSWLPRSVYSTSFSGPFVTEPDASGKREIIGLAWREPGDRDGLFVVAFDRESLREKWRAGPYPGFRAREGQDNFHLAVLGERAVVTDARGVLHTLDARTGQERAVKTLANPPYAMCVAGKGAAARVILPLDGGWRAANPHDPNGSALFSYEINKVTLALDPTTGRTTPAPPYTVCSSDHYCMWKEVDGCRDLEQRANAPSLNLRVNVQEVWNSGDDRVSLGGSRSSNLPATAVGWTAKTRAVQWEALLIAPENPQREKPVTHAAIDTNSFFYLYATRDGPSRLIALATKTGDRRFDIELPGSAIGTRFREIIPGGDDVFVAMNDELVVIDARLGKVRGRLGSF